MIVCFEDTRQVRFWVKSGSYGGYSTASALHPKADVMKRARQRSLVGQETMSDVSDVCLGLLHVGR